MHAVWIALVVYMQWRLMICTARNSSKNVLCAGSAGDPASRFGAAGARAVGGSSAAPSSQDLLGRIRAQQEALKSGVWVVMCSCMCV